MTLLGRQTPEILTHIFQTDADVPTSPPYLVECGLKLMTARFESSSLEHPSICSTCEEKFFEKTTYKKHTYLVKVYPSKR